MSFLRGLATMGALAGGVMHGIDQKRRMDAQDEELAARREDREYQKKQRDLQEQTRVRMADALAPVTAAPNMVKSDDADNIDVGADPGATVQQGYRVGNQAYADQAAADAAVAQANTPDAKLARMTDVMGQAGDWQGAQALRTSARQERLATLQERQLTDADARDKALREVGGLIIKGGWGAVPEVYKRYNDGMTATVKEDGKGGATVATLDDQGKQVSAKSFATLSDLFGSVAGQFDPSKWQSAEEARIARDREDKRYTQEFDLKKRLTDAQIGYYSDRGMSSLLKANGAGSSAGQPQQAPIWDKESDEFLKKRYTVADPATGQMQVDGDGLQFAKQVALAQARRNGGDTTSALGYAFELDNKIKGDTKGDPAAVRAKRQELLQGLMTPPAPAGQAAAAAGGAAAPQVPSPSGEPAPPVQGQRVRQTPIINFNGGAPSAVQQRMQAARAQLPAVQAEYQAAAAELRKAQSSGPMAVAAARDRLSNIRTRMAEIQARAGE